jgi:hypothetical protein
MKVRKQLRNTSLNVCSLALGILAISGFVARATPYASELTNNAGTVSFTLNEGGSVKVYYGTTTNNLGNLASGRFSFALGATSPFFVQVTSTNTGAGYKTAVSPLVAGRIQLPTTNDVNDARFPTPRGVAVNKNPASPYFGRVYVANSTPATIVTPAPTATNRVVGRGIYALRSDLTDSALGFGTNAQNGNIKFAGNPGGPAASANSPYKLTVGEDDEIYICDFSDSNGNLYRIDGSLTNGEWVFDWQGGPGGPIGSPTNHGSLIKAVAEGSTNAGNLTLWTIDEDLGASVNNDLWKYTLGSGPMTNQTYPTDISSALLNAATVDFCKGGPPNNYIYLMQNRSIPATQPGIIIIDTNGVTITNTRDLWRTITGNPSDNDVLSNLQAIAVSPAGDYLACTMQGGFEGFKTYIIPLVNGIPDLANRSQLTSGSIIQGRALDFDIAGNIYTVSSGDALVRAFSPGGFSVATSGSGGTFSLFRPATTVSVTGTSSVSEAGPAGTFTLTRSDNVGSLTVGFTMSGTATSNVDYTLSANGSVTFLPGDFSTNITFTPVPDNIPELTESATLQLLPNPNFSQGSPSAATITITDDETPMVDILVKQATMYERVANDYTTFQLVRRGDTSAATFTVNLNYAGTATINVDYNATATVNFDPGQVTNTFTITPIDDSLVEGPETVIISVASGSGYTVGTNSTSATATIVDDDLPPETVLFSENFENSETATNWMTLFGSRNGVDDFTYNFSFGYTGVLPLAPHSAGGESQGLYMTVNKSEATPLGGAGLNAYMTNQSFSGNYALRFDMYLIQNNGAATTEYAMFGINHDGTHTNWFRDTAGGSTNDTYGIAKYDGLWYALTADGSDLGVGETSANTGDYVLNSSPTVGTGPSNLAIAHSPSFTGVFKSPPWAAGGVGGGSPANVDGSATPTWADVEIAHSNGVVTLKINNTVILTYVNGTAYTSGKIMLGYDDPFDSIGVAAAVIYDNVRVVQLGTPAISITSIKIINSGTQVQVDFNAGTTDTTASFTLQSASTVNGTYGNVSSSITQLSPGSFRSVSSVNGSAQFYRIKRL